MGEKGDRPRVRRMSPQDRLRREREGVIELLVQLDEAIEKVPDDKWSINMRKHYERRLVQLNTLIEQYGE